MEPRHQRSWRCCSRRSLVAASAGCMRDWMVVTLVLVTLGLFLILMFGLWYTGP